MKKIRITFDWISDSAEFSVSNIKKMLFVEQMEQTPAASEGDDFILIDAIELEDVE